jgi:hypothetical protein
MQHFAKGGFVPAPIYVEVVGFVCNLKTLETDACVATVCQGEVRLSIFSVETVEEQE